MTQAGAQASALYKEILNAGRLWTIRDQDGFPAPMTPDGHRAQPFWSSIRRVERIVAEVVAYRGFQPVEVSLTDFMDTWLPGLERDGIFVGMNWTGPRAVGYDLPAPTVASALQAHLDAK